MRISDFIEQSNRALRPDDAFDLFTAATRDLGFDRVVYAVVSGPPDRNVTDTPGFVLNYPADWVAHYFERGLDKVDPVTQYAFYAPGAFLWSDLPRLTKLSKPQKDVMRACREAGLHDGVCIPIHGAFGHHTDVGLASSAPGSDPGANLDTLTVLATQFNTIYVRLVETARESPSRISLTPREREVLLWSYHGKSSWVIGELLDISEAAVNFHVANAMKKLDSNTRLMAILRAIKFGLIFP